MSVKHIGLVLDHFAPKNSTLKLVAIILADHADSDGVCWPSYRKIAQRANIHERSVQRYVKELQDLGIIVKMRTGTILKKEGKAVRVSNLYRFKLGHLMANSSKLSTDDLLVTDTDVYLEGDTGVVGRSTQVSTKPSINRKSNRQACENVDNYLRATSAGSLVDDLIGKLA